MKVKILPGGFPLYKKHDTDAGYDMALPKEVILYPGDEVFVDLKVAVAIPEGWVGLLINRSSLAVKFDCIGNLGVIDSDYRGSIKFKMFNIGNEIVGLSVGERVAQLVVVPSYQVPVEYVKDLDDTERGEGGFGSTGRVLTLDQELRKIDLQTMADR